MRIDGGRETNAAVDYSDSAVRSWSEWTPILMRPAVCDECICAVITIFWSGYWFTLALNLGLLTRTIWGVGTPRGLQGGSAVLILATDLFVFALVCGRYSKKRQAMARQRYASERDNCRSIRSDAARTPPAATANCLISNLGC